MAATRSIPLLTALALAACAAPAVRAVPEMDAGLDREFHWTEELSPGAWLSIRNTQGPIEVRGTAGRRATVRAEGDGPASGSAFRIQVVRDGREITLCAVTSDGDACTFDAPWRYRPVGERPAERVRFTVALPEGVHLRARSDNGEVTVRDAGGDVEVVSGFGRVHVASAAGAVLAASGSGEVRVDGAVEAVTATTGNGNIRVSSAAGPIDVNTGNGDVEVELGSARAARRMSLSTGNGSIVLWLPRDFAGTVDASTGHGRVASDFPLAGVEQFPTQRHVRGSIGSGGHEIFLSTGRGDIRMRRLQ